jgi:HEAT repeat protein
MAALALGTIGDAEDVPVLVGRLPDPDPDLRWATALFPGELGAVEAMDALVRAAQHERTPTGPSRDPRAGAVELILGHRGGTVQR